MGDVVVGWRGQTDLTSGAIAHAVVKFLSQCSWRLSFQGPGGDLLRVDLAVGDLASGGCRRVHASVRKWLDDDAEPEYVAKYQREVRAGVDRALSIVTDLIKAQEQFDEAVEIALGSTEGGKLAHAFLLVQEHFDRVESVTQSLAERLRAVENATERLVAMGSSTRLVEVRQSEEGSEDKAA